MITILLSLHIDEWITLLGKAEARGLRGLCKPYSCMINGRDLSKYGTCYQLGDIVFTYYLRRLWSPKYFPESKW